MTVLLFVCTVLAGSFGARADSLFPVDYEESRARFRDGCYQSQARGPGFCRGYGVPSRTYGDLSVDAAYFTRGGSRLLILQSGTHGPEGYVGAAIQELARRNHLDRLLDRGIDVLFIHSLNPFGYRAGRRGDEDNVNLNRNFLLADETFVRPNPSYRRMRSTFEPRGRVGGMTLDYLGVDAGLLWFWARFGKAEVRRAMNVGQYEFARGVNYGGVAPAPQVGILRDLLTPLIAAHRRTLFIDWHTGLGKNGFLHLMTGRTSNPSLLTDLRSTFAGLVEEDIVVTDGAADDGFYPASGTIDAFVPGLATDGAQVVGVTAEFGTMGVETVPQMRTAHRMIVENQAWFHGCADPLICAAVRADFVGLFNPPDQRWRAGVLRQADRFLNAVARSFK